MSGHTLDLAVNRHVNFAHARETYVIYPWVGDGDELVRPLRLGQQDVQILLRLDRLVLLRCRLRRLLLALEGRDGSGFLAGVLLLV